MVDKITHLLCVSHDQLEGKVADRYCEIPAL